MVISILRACRDSTRKAVTKAALIGHTGKSKKSDVSDKVKLFMSIIRERAGKDRRTIDVRVTPAGLAFMRQSLGDSDLVEEEVMSCLDEDEIETLRNLIRVLRFTLIEKSGKRTDAQAYYYRGITYKALSKKAKAVADLEMCIKLSWDRSLTKAARRELEELRGQ